MIRWEAEAEELLKKVPFFVRRKVKGQVEEYARRKGQNLITKKFLLEAKKALRDKASQAEEGFMVEGCFGSSGCPHAITSSDSLLEELEAVLKEEDFTSFLKQAIGGPLKHHHQFRIALAECPNACSQVQIRDFALIGQARLGLFPERCTMCGTCVEICEEGAVELSPAGPVLREACLSCGACARNCPEEAIRVEDKGYKVLLGGKLGRHPQLALELLPFVPARKVPLLLRKVIAFYKTHQKGGERLGSIIQRLGWAQVKKELLSDL